MPWFQFHLYLQFQFRAHVYPMRQQMMAQVNLGSCHTRDTQIEFLAPGFKAKPQPLQAFENWIKILYIYTHYIWDNLPLFCVFPLCFFLFLSLSPITFQINNFSNTKKITSFVNSRRDFMFRFPPSPLMRPIIN